MHFNTTYANKRSFGCLEDIFGKVVNLLLREAFKYEKMDLLSSKVGQANSSI